jgi:Uma2 family endonuclease
MAVRDTVDRKLTYEDYLLFPDDGKRHEILDGEHYVTAAPYPKHQRVLGELHFWFKSFLREHRLGQVYFAPLDVLLSRHDVAQPDLLYISNERMAVLTEKNVQGAPDLVVEVLSGSSRRLDERIKLARYGLCGVREYWIVNPSRNAVRIFRRMGERLREENELTAAAGDRLTPPLLPELEIPLAEIFQ